MAQLEPGGGEVAREVADRRRRADHPEDAQLLPAAGVVRLRHERGVQEQEPHHHLDRAVAPQRSNGVAAQRLSWFARSLELVGVAAQLRAATVVGQRGGYL